MYIPWVGAASASLMLFKVYKIEFCANLQIHRLLIQCKDKNKFNITMVHLYCLTRKRERQLPTNIIFYL